jgi:hypothetical protein
MPFTREEDADGARYVWFTNCRAGFPYAYVPTADLPRSASFVEVDSTTPPAGLRPGDVVWWPTFMAMMATPGGPLVRPGRLLRLDTLTAHLGPPRFFRRRIEVRTVSPAESPGVTSSGSTSSNMRRTDSPPLSTRRETAAWRGSVRTFPLFSMFVPDEARIIAIDSTKGEVSLAWPDCPRCQFTVTVRPDSGIDVEARIAQLVAQQRTIDSINHDPYTVLHEFDEIHGPPQPFRTTSGRGYLVNVDCGDCAHVELYFGRPGYVAYVELLADDDVPDVSRHLREMIEIGKTFAWRQ